MSPRSIALFPTGEIVILGFDLAIILYDMKDFVARFKWVNALIAFFAVCGPALLTYLNDQEWIKSNPQAVPVVAFIALLVGLSTKFYKHEPPTPSVDTEGQ